MDLEKCRIYIYILNVIYLDYEIYFIHLLQIAQRFYIISFFTYLLGPQLLRCLLVHLGDRPQPHSQQGPGTVPQCLQ